MTALAAAFFLSMPPSCHACLNEQVWVHSGALPVVGQTQRRNSKGLNVLVFSKTTGFRHDSIPEGHAMFADFARLQGWNVTSTEDSQYFAAERLKPYQVAVFLNTTGDVLNAEQQASMERWVANGGGFVGIHSAADTEYDWPWYGRLVGAYFMSHPNIQPADVLVIDRRHPATRALPAVWRRTDEWYDYRARPVPSVRILANLDTKSFTGHKMGDPHPIMWSHEMGRGRSFYAGMGHTKETYSEPLYRDMIVDAVLWAARRTN